MLASALLAAALPSLADGSSGASGAKHRPGPRTGDPLWTLDLHAHGYGWHPDAHGVVGDEDTDLAFGSNTELVVLGYTSNVRAFVIDARAGTVVRTREWPCHGGSAVFATAGGNYAVHDQGTVLYGPGLVDERARSPHRVSMLSPNGRRFAASTRPVKETVWITLDADTLAETGVIADFHQGALAERSIATVVLGLQQGPFIRIATIDRDPVIYQPKWGTGHPRFASEKALVVVGPDRFDVITIDGTLLFSEPDGWENGIRIPASRDGRRMVVTRGRYSGHMRRVLSREEVKVYDLEAKAPVWAGRFKEMKGAFSEHSGVAISPDGALLAINSRGRVRLFRIPGVGVE